MQRPLAVLLQPPLLPQQAPPLSSIKSEHTLLIRHTPLPSQDGQASTIVLIPLPKKESPRKRLWTLGLRNWIAAVAATITWTVFWALVGLVSEETDWIGERDSELEVQGEWEEVREKQNEEERTFWNHT